jgi:hypothetical protein
MIMKTKSIATLTLLTLALATPAQAADAGVKTDSPDAGAAAVERVPSGTVAGSRAEDQRYAAREAASPNAKQYKGGDVVVITASAAAVVLLAVILIIILL